MGDMVIVAYRPKAGCDGALLDLVKDHVPCLRRLGLATNRPALAMRGKEGVIVEVFEWCSAESIAQAHSNSAVQSLWEKFAALCDYTPLANLSEALEMFAEFDAVEL